jgi:hypothetical protein
MVGFSFFLICLFARGRRSNQSAKLTFEIYLKRAAMLDRRDRRKSFFTPA